MNDRTKAILINNPSNPCGSSYSQAHITDIVNFARYEPPLLLLVSADSCIKLNHYDRKHKLPIIADEIYGGCVFNGSFTPISAVAVDVPVLTIGGERVSMWGSSSG